MSNHAASLPANRRAISHVLLAMLMLALGSAAQASGSPRADEDAAFSPASSASRGTHYFARRGMRNRLEITADFLHFDNRLLRLNFSLPHDAVHDSMREYGAVTADVDAVIETCRREAGCDDREFARRILRYYHDRGLRLVSDEQQRQRLRVDVPAAVSRNRERIRPLAEALQRLAVEQRRGPQWAQEAAIALVQGGLGYQQPGTWDQGRKIVGFYPPPQALERGVGDCDTKSALLAAILQNLSDAPMIGIHIPQHYLLGIAGTPRAGQATIRYGNRDYLLIEAAGPARRPPGEVAAETGVALARGIGIRIDPLR